MSGFFINRPIFAWVIAIVIMLGGLLAVNSLSISRYPQIAPTTVSISGSYPGADAQTVENSVTKVIEQGMTGIDNLDYMTSTSSSTGSTSISLTFTSAADPDVAQMQVQNKLQLVTSQLPQIVQSNGLTVTKSSTGFLMVVAFVSTDGKMTSTDLADYVDSTLNDTLKRVEGVGSTQLFGSGYSMRIWLDPDKLAKYALMPSDVSTAIQAQNTQVSAGQLGAMPARQGQQLNATVTARSRLQTPEQFRNIILKSATDGSLVRLNDVARVEVGAESYTTSAAYNGMPAAGLAINLATGANAISAAEAVQSAIARLSTTFPEGVQVYYPYDTTPFVLLSIEEVVKTLIEAIILVFVVMFVFLQNIRATLIPSIAVPVVLLGTFGVLAVAGYSINTLTMFAMVLAIGLLVDDAIVVVENVERVMQEEKLPPKEATQKSMKEIDRGSHRHRHGVVRCLRAHGFLRWLYRHHLSPVLRHHRRGHGALRRGCTGADAGSVRNHSSRACRRPCGAQGHLRLVQPDFRPQHDGLSQRRARHHSAKQTVSGDFPGDCDCHGLDVCASAKLVPSRRRPGHFDHERATAGRGDAGPDIACFEAGVGPFPQR